MSIQVKICGITDPSMASFAARAGADWVGFVFVPASPRAVTVARAGLCLTELQVATPVALLSDAEDALIDVLHFMGFSVFQLHGRETPERVAQIKARTGGEIWKAIGVSARADLERANAYTMADRFLIDANPPAGAKVEGGHGASFDWSILEGWDAPKPWILAGGLTPENVAEAIRITGARAVDVSSGVERSRGVKDEGLIEAFLKAVKEA